MSIPKIIHQTWKDHNIPHDIYKKKWIDSWRIYHPDWEYKFWTDEDLRDLIEKHYPWFLDIYDAYEYNICRVDAARPFILKKYGGMYVDLDFECLKNFDDLISYDAVLGTVRPNLNGMKHHSIPNALMMSIPEHPFWDTVIFKMEESFNKIYKMEKYVEIVKSFNKYHKIFELTGPALLYYSVLYYRIILNNKDIFVAPYDYFYPNKPKDISYAITYWAHQW